MKAMSREANRNFVALRSVSHPVFTFYALLALFP